MKRFAPALAAFLLFAGRGEASPSAAETEEFFIVSSVDAGKGTMVLKRPTEVTVVLKVTPRTRCTSEKGTPIRFTDLKAGDTVFIGVARERSGELVAASIREGIMTLQELRRRYLRSASP